jgi:hypothetical protein
MGLIRNESLVEAMKRVRLVPDSTTSVSIQTTSEQGYVRMAYEYVDEDGEHVVETTRIIDAHAHGLDQLDWTSLLRDRITMSSGAS